jgi:hypothetical protein
MAKSTIMTPFFFTRPTRGMQPTKRQIDIPVRKTRSARRAPKPANGRAEKIVIGWRRSLSGIPGASWMRKTDLMRVRRLRTSRFSSLVRLGDRNGCLDRASECRLAEFDAWHMISLSEPRWNPV